MALNDLLHDADLLADRDHAAELRLQVLRRRQVVGVGMGFEDPIHPQPVGADMRDQRIGRRGVGVARLEVVAEHWVDDRGAPARRVGDDVADGAGDRVDEAADARRCSHR